MDRILIRGCPKYTHNPFSSVFSIFFNLYSHIIYFQIAFFKHFVFLTRFLYVYCIYIYIIFQKKIFMQYPSALNLFAISGCGYSLHHHYIHHYHYITIISITIHHHYTSLRYITIHHYLSKVVLHQTARSTFTEIFYLTFKGCLMFFPK